MRDDGKYLDGREIKYKPYISLVLQLRHLHQNQNTRPGGNIKRSMPGHSSCTTNLIFDIHGLEDGLRNSTGGHTRQGIIIAGIAPLRSLRMAHHLRYEVPGVVVPDSVIRRIEKAGVNAEEEGIQLALEMTQKIIRMRGCTASI
jgi:methylenetetrahydrofolate reductase (NADPH)